MRNFSNSDTFIDANTKWAKMSSYANKQTFESLITNSLRSITKKESDFNIKISKSYDFSLLFSDKDELQNPDSVCIVKDHTVDFRCNSEGVLDQEISDTTSLNYDSSCLDINFINI